MHGFKIINEDCPIRVGIVNLPNALASSIVGLQDIFNIANNFCIDASKERSFKVEVLHVDPLNENFSSSIRIKSVKIDLSDNFDIIIIPPIIDDQQSLSAPQELQQWLKQMYLKGSYISSVCVGAYILAQSGLLDNKKVTTHWILESKMKNNFPLIDLHINKIIIEDQNIITAGGVSAYMDLALYFIRKYISIEASYICANFLIVDAGRTSQKHYKNLATLAPIPDNELKTLIKWIDLNYQYPIVTIDLAKRINVSERTLTRKFIEIIGISPTKYLQKIRVQKAKDLLINSSKTFEDITCMVGYEDLPTFRRLFKKMTALTPSEYRKIFMVK